MATRSRMSGPRRLTLVFAIGVAWVGLVRSVAHVVIRDDDWSWAETAAQSVMGGFMALVIAAVIPPRRLQAIQRPVASALYRGTLPQHVDQELWRAALDHHRHALWLWRWLFPLLFGGGALVCAVAAFFVTGGGLAAVLGIGLGFSVAAVGCRIFAERRDATLDDLLAELDRRDVGAD